MPEENTLYLTINLPQVTSSLRALFSPCDPASVRCFAILEGHAAGKIFTDNPEYPTWAVLQEAAFGSLYLAGDIQPLLLHQMVSNLRLAGDVLVGMMPDDPRWALMPASPDYSGYTLEFTDCEPERPLPEIPAGCELRRLDESLFKQIVGRNMLIHMYGNMQQALIWGYGLCLLRRDELLCETFAGPASNGIIEIGVETHPHHMEKGYATLTCLHLIHRMEEHGYRTYWNCAQQNQPSITLARKLGYKTEKEYRLVAWSKNDTT